MTTDVLQNIVARCHQRHEKPFKQRKTILTPLIHKGLPYHFTVHCAHGYPVLLQDLEAAGISFDAATVENIQAFPAVCADPSWTFWHQLKRFFAHYTRDADAPMRWEDEVLQFRMPPVLHPSVQYLFVNTPVLYPEHLRRAFLDTEIEILRTQPIQRRTRPERL